MKHSRPSRPRSRRAFIATSVAAVVVGTGGVIGGVAGPEAATAQIGTETAAYTAAAHRSSVSATRSADRAASRGDRAGHSSSWWRNRPPQPTTAPPAPPAQTSTAGTQTQRSTSTSTHPSTSTRPRPTTPAPAPTSTSTGTTGATTSSGSGFASVEEFATPVAQGQWPSDGSAPSAYPDYVSYADGTSGKYYPSQVLSVHDGVLDWNVHRSMAAAVLPFGYEGFTYGTYTVRMRADRFPGYHIAFLLWPNTDQWTHELDGPESETDATHPYPAVLQSSNPVRFAPAQTTPVPQSWNDTAFHNYTWQWGPDFVAFYQDGTLVTKVTSNVPREGMHPVLQVEFSNSGQKPDPSISGHVYVDRVMYDPSYAIGVPTS